jgi:limonene-1,2-epoxide hydrolase
MSTQNLLRVIQFYEALSPEDVPRMGEIYAKHASFKDPFNRVVGVDLIAAIFEGMFQTLREPRFTIITAIERGGDAFLTWDFTFRVKKFRPDHTMTIHGASHLQFDAEGKIVMHRDYWDAAEELYSKLPVVGTFMRALQRKFAH